MEKGEWKVFSQVLGSERKYIVGRQLNMSELLHGGNVEYVQGMCYTASESAAESICKTLNEGNHVLPQCSKCSGINLQPSGSCAVCTDCGTSTGCS